jgi:endonuclease/exonuclease/phosphatase family metal-dependent hydrolase
MFDLFNSKKLISVFLSVFIFFYFYASVNAEDLTIMSFNIMWGGQTNKRLKKIAEGIKRNKIDIVGFQEVRGFYTYKANRSRKRTGKYIQKYLKEIGWEMPYLSSAVNRDVRVLSRFPISNYENLNIENSQTMIIETPEGKLRFINTHCLPAGKGCQRQKQLIERAIKYNNYPKVILGDFNCSVFGAPYEKTTELFYDACNCKTCRGTVNIQKFNKVHNQDWSYDCPWQSIDHIYVEKNTILKVKNSLVPERMNSSDHFPVIAQIDFSRCKECNSGKQRVKGDANCDRIINSIDFSMWLDGYRKGAFSKYWEDVDFNCGASVPENTNLLSNPSFENGFSAWKKRGIDSIIKQEEVLFGKNSLHADKQNKTDWGSFSQDISHKFISGGINKGDTFTASIWVKSRNGKRKGEFSIWEIGGSEENIKTRINFVASEKEGWKKIQLHSRVTGLGRKRLRYEVYLFNPVWDYIFDGALLEKGNTQGEYRQSKYIDSDDLKIWMKRYF